MHAEHDAVLATCTAYGEAMKAMDVAAMKSTWDSGFDHLVYQPEEYAQPCRSWDEIVAYWEYIPTAVDRITEWTILDADVAVAGDLALVFLQARTEFDVKGMDEPLAGDVRFSLGLSRASGSWLLVHAHESRMLDVDGAGH